MSVLPTARDALDSVAWLVESAPDAGLALGCDGTVRLVGRRACAVLWQAEEDLVGLNVCDLVHPDYRGRFEAQLARVCADPTRSTSGFPLALLRGAMRLTARAWLAGVPAAGCVLLWLREEQAVEDRATRSVRDINDEVLQAIATASYAHQRGAAREVTEALERAGSAARRVLGELGSGPGTREAARLEPVPASTPSELAQLPPVRDEMVRVLVADDDGAVRAQVRAVLLAVEGVEVVGEAADGDDAVRLAVELEPDLMFVDLSMPGRDGYEVLAEVRRSCPGTRMVALSGFSREQAAVTALQHGATAYIEKGGAVGRFATLLDDLFPQRSRRRSRQGPSVTPTDPAQGSDLVSLYSHELRSPISAQLLAADLILEAAGAGTPVAGLAQRVRDNATKMNRLVQDLSDADRVGHGNLNLAVEATDLLAVVETARRTSSHVIDPARVIVRRRSEPVVAADPFRLQQILENLLSNAAKFGPDTAEVRLEVRADDNQAVVDVSDEGPGIALADRERVFGRFERLGATQPGIGLGLYLSREIARAHGGDLDVVTGLTSGTTFRLTVPLFADRRPAAPASSEH